MTEAAVDPQVSKRLLRDYRSIIQNPPTGITAAPREDNILQWDAIIFGPEDTCFAAGTFSLELTFSNDYPEKAPKIKFLTQMFHPNIYKGGHICLDILQDKWSSTYDVAGILTSIQSLLADPNPDSPANTEAAEMYRDHRSQYERTVIAMIKAQMESDSDSSDGE